MASEGQWFSQSLLQSAAVAASASQALLAAPWSGQMFSVETVQMPAVEAEQKSAVETRHTFSAET